MTDRVHAIEQIRARLLSRVSPRAHMSAIIAGAAGAGFLASFALLRAGVTSMALRYPLAVGAAYLAFLALLWLWLRRYQLRVERDRARDRWRSDDPWSAIDIVNIPIDLEGDAAGDVASPEFGGGGGFAGGGAGGSIESAGQVARLAPRVPPSPASLSGGGKGSGFSLGLDSLDEGAWVLIPVAIVSAIVLSAAIYVVWMAPILFAELLLDAALAAGLYRRLRGVQGQHWLRSAIRRTAGPAIVAAVLLGLAGGLMQSVYPGATSIGRVWERATEPERAP